MDPDTQRMIERTRQRREILSQRIADMPEAVPRKRRTPVLENNSCEKVLSEKGVNEDDSPKRQCVRKTEQELKPDTPAIQGVQSRIKDLGSSLSTENDENAVECAPVPTPRKSISSPPLEKKVPTKSVSPSKHLSASAPLGSRKGRFAALAQSISDWEDDMTHHVIHKEEEKKPRWQPPQKDTFSQSAPAASTKISYAPPPPPVSAAKAVVSSPKKTHAPPTPRSTVLGSPAKSTPSTNFARGSPMRTSKVELNSSPKPFSPGYKGNAVSSPSHCNDVSRSASVIRSVMSPSRNKPSSPYKETDHLPVTPVKTSVMTTTAPADLPVNAPGLNETPPSDGELNQIANEPTLKPVSQRFASWAEKVDTPKMKVMEPSTQPLSAKLATFEKKIAYNTPSSSISSSTSVHVARVPKQVCTPAGPTTPATSSIKRPADCDPSELPISLRMSQMQEKLVNSARRKKEEEPTAFSVGARMSAWETMTSANNVSNIKKVNPGEVTPVSKAKPVSATPKSSAGAQNPPPTQAVRKGVTPHKSFKDSIEEKAAQMSAKRPTSNTTNKTHCSPVKSTSRSPAKGLGCSPSKIVHSPSKVSKGTKLVEQHLLDTAQENNTTCGSMAAQIRAARMAELETISNRWNNGVLKDETGSTSDSQTKEDVSIPENNPPQLTPNDKKRQEMREKARQNFNSKLAEAGLTEETKSNPPQRPPPPKGNTPHKSTPTSSIYNLVKKKEESSAKKHSPSKVKRSITASDEVKFNDSFDGSDDESKCKIPRTAALRAAKQASEEEEEFKKPAPPKAADEDKESDRTSTASSDEFNTAASLSMEVDDDDISLRGFVSEAVRRESILPPRHQQRPESSSSLESYDDESGDYDNSKVTGYRPDDESMDDDDCNESNDPDALNDLLDEALQDEDEDYDPDMDPKNVVMRKKKPEPQTTDEEYDPDMDINNVVLRRKPQPAHSNPSAPVPKQRHMRAMESTDDDEDDDRPYSLSAYRKSANIHQYTMEPVVRKSKYAGRQVVEEDIPMPSARPQRDDKRAVQERIKELQDLVQQEQNVIMQTSNALNKCCLGNAYFAGSAEQVECNRLLLIACQKRQTYMTEIQRLKETCQLSISASGPQGSLTISDIRLPLKKDFVTKIGTSHDTMTYYFILLIRNGCQIICTQMLSSHDPMMRGSLDFPNLIKINGITGNFKLTIDIYSMSISKEAISKDKKRKTPKKGKGYASTLESPGGPTAVRTTSFSHVTSLTLTMKSLDKTSFHLDRLPYLSPLYGQIFMRLKCLMESNVEERGFLTMFDDVSGFGAWHRRWCVLSSNKLCVWKYPDDETRKDPMSIIDLKRCVTDKVGLIPRDICARPNTFEMVTVRQPLKGEHDTLITRTHNTMTTVRHQISADTKEERIMWCNKINRTLANLRTWNPDALKPMK